MTNYYLIMKFIKTSRRPAGSFITYFDFLRVFLLAISVIKFIATIAENLPREISRKPR